MSSREFVYLVIAACFVLAGMCLAAIYKNRDGVDTHDNKSGDNEKRPSLLLHYIKVIAGFVVLMWFLNSPITLDSVSNYLGFNKNNADTQPIAQSPAPTPKAKEQSNSSEGSGKFDFSKAINQASSNKKEPAQRVTQTMTDSMPLLSYDAVAYRLDIIDSGQDFATHLMTSQKCIDGRGEVIGSTPGLCQWPIIDPKIPPKPKQLNEAADFALIKHALPSGEIINITATTEKQIRPFIERGENIREVFRRSRICLTRGGHTAEIPNNNCVWPDLASYRELQNV